MEKLRTVLLDCIHILELIHTRETTGRGPSYSNYRGQVAATIREGKQVLEGDEMNRYSNKRHRGPKDRGFTPTIMAMEGSIVVCVAVKPTKLMDEIDHYRGFYLHNTKGWRSNGPEGKRK